MAKKEEEKKVKKLSSQESFKILANAFYEASGITFSLVFFPIVILLAGVFIDKKFSTTPLFIIFGIILSVIVGIYQAIKVRKIKSSNG